MNAQTGARKGITMKGLAVTLATIGALALCAETAAAQGRGGDRFAQADANGDGAISIQEMRNARAQGFDRMDQNGDGQLSGGEIRQQAARADRNGDGVVSRDEFVNGPMPAFEQFDANADSVLDAQELAAARSAMQSRRNRNGS
jgi:Ca2+-binding EF-hand superfamily protein